MKHKNTVWITGASSGIGKALSNKFIHSNLKVIASSRNIDSLKLTEQEEGKIFPYKCDVSNSQEVFDTVEKINEKFEISCLINNAGITSFKPFIENSLSEIESIIKTNLLGAIYTTKSVLPSMIDRNSGTIINIISVAAQKIFTNSSVYSASKAGLEYFSKVLREELRAYNIRIINIYPGATVSGIWNDSVMDKFSEKMMTSEDLAEFIFSIFQSNSKISPEEIVVRPISGDL